MRRRSSGGTTIPVEQLGRHIGVTRPPRNEILAAVNMRPRTGSQLVSVDGEPRRPKSHAWPSLRTELGLFGGGARSEGTLISGDSPNAGSTLVRAVLRASAQIQAAWQQ